MIAQMSWAWTWPDYGLLALFSVISLLQYRTISEMIRQLKALQDLER